MTTILESNRQRFGSEFTKTQFVNQQKTLEIKKGKKNPNLIRRERVERDW